MEHQHQILAYWNEGAQVYMCEAKDGHTIETVGGNGERVESIVCPQCRNVTIYDATTSNGKESTIVTEFCFDPLTVSKPKKV